MIPSREIPLSFNRADYEEIYLPGNSRKIWLTKGIRPYFNLALASAFLLAGSLVYSLERHNGWGVVTVIAVLFILGVYELTRKMGPALKSNRAIGDLLLEQSRFISQKVILTDHTLSLRQDTKITMVRWEDFKRAVIDDRSIRLYGSEELLFPKKSFSYTDYDLLKEQVLLHMKDPAAINGRSTAVLPTSL